MSQLTNCFAYPWSYKLSDKAKIVDYGDVVGTVTVTMQGETVGTVDLLAGSSVDRNELLYTMAKVKAFFSSTYLRSLLCFAS